MPLPNQVVIQRKNDGFFLKRKASYGETTWTEDVQQAQLFTPRGAERCIPTIYDGWDAAGRVHDPDLYCTREVRVQLREE